MKRFLALALSFILVLSLAACGETEETDEQKAARALDSKVWASVTTASDDLQALPDFLAGVADGDTADALGVMASVLKAEQGSLDALTAETQPALLYVGAARAYIANARVIYEKAHDFIQDGAAKDNDDLLHYLSMVDDLTTNAVEKRKDFLSAAGFTADEIAAFPAEIRLED